MRIVLCSLNAKYIHSCLALRYLKASLSQEQGFDIIMREFSINDLEERVLNELYQERADIYAFSCYIWNTEASLRVAADLKKLSATSKMVLGGPEVGSEAESILARQPFIDAIVRGEGERPFRLMALALRDGKTWEGIPGLVHHSGDQAAEILETDEIPFPYENCIPEWQESDGQHRILYYESSRGCPYGCTYCLSAGDRKLRHLNLGRVFRELDKLLNLPARELKFVDRCFNADEKRCREIMKHILGHPSSMPVHFEINGDRLSDEMLDFLSTVPPGRFNFEIGVQSSDPGVLAAVNRKSDLERLKSSIDRLVSSGNIHIHLDLLAGLPGENLELFRKSFDWVYQRRPHKIQLGFLKMLKGSPLNSDAARHGYICQDHPPYEILANRYISHNDLILLKDIEQVLERSYNSCLMPCSLSYIIEESYQGRAFDFYREAAAFWRAEDTLYRECKREEYYNLVLRFVGKCHQKYFEVFSEWARYDYMCHNSSLNLPEELADSRPAERNLHMLELFGEDASVRELAWKSGFPSVREARRHLHVQYFRLDPRNGRKADPPVPVVFGYGRHNRRFVACAYPVPAR